MELGFNGAQLRLACVFNGFALEDVAERVDRTRQYVHKLETNQSSPTEELSSHLAEVLRVLPAFFHLQRIEVSEEQFHFRKLFTTRAMLKQVALARAELFGRLVSTTLTACCRCPRSTYQLPRWRALRTSNT
jgi:transcriptional regulator with XRE-family HTH domain